MKGEKMLIEKLIDLADLQGGGTLGVHGLPIPTSGYVVGCGNLYTGRLPEYKQMVEIQELINAYGGGYIGAWIDAGILYIDKVTIYDDLNAALNAAHEYKELAIYDIAKAETIYTKDKLSVYDPVSGDTYFIDK